jgi:hypothetical protein
MKRVYPEATLTGFASRANIGAFTLIHGFDEVVALPGDAPASGQSHDKLARLLSDGGDH